ncbi:hypothetical protein LEM8419_00943 [Neolewinella maritima]|uniref:T9SS type A sorting domain-containing protein n=1 Tax=Neolewinella maritima TaxID=1383882 RepID=A0ABN8F3F5_9BACT|nr:CotH kinase family protein [Neolewinella maritima]CAH0999643.1 hypothetical protein LEM8419_00943 [Neolewinella maritima]
MLRLVALLLFPVLGVAQANFSSSLPLLLIDTEGREIVDDPKVTARLSVIDHADGTPNRPGDAPTGYVGLVGIELRGSTSQTLFPKKGFGFETRDADGKGLDVALLGLPEEEDWVLHNPYSDKSLIRNALTYRLAGEIMEYAPRTRLVEVLINGDYLGVYLLTEKIKRDKNRVDVSKLTEDDNSGEQLTGGYLLKFDKETGETAAGGTPLLFTSKYGSAVTAGEEVRMLYDYPKAEDITAAQRRYIQDFMYDFEDRLAGDDFTDPEAGYRPLIDVQSFVDFLIINEVTRNVDGYRLSSWMYKEKDSKGGKLHMGPVWDFNLGFGNADYCEGDNTAGWQYEFNSRCSGDRWLIPFWWKRLLKDPYFRALLRARWEELRAGPLSDTRIDAVVDSLVTELGGAAERNFVRWPVLGTRVWPNAFVGADYASELNYLEGWIDDRMAWLDGAVETTTPVRTEPEPLTVALAPNPTTGTFRLVAPPALQIGRTYLYDSFGRLLLTGTPGQRSFDLSRFPAGVYALTTSIAGRQHVGRVMLR